MNYTHDPASERVGTKIGSRDNLGKTELPLYVRAQRLDHIGIQGGVLHVDTLGDSNEYESVRIEGRATRDATDPFHS